MNLKHEGRTWVDRIFKAIVLFAILGSVLLAVGSFLVNDMISKIIKAGTSDDGTGKGHN